MRILFCSDIHGNTLQYFKIFAHAIDYDALILGGDLCPKGLGEEMSTQREFLETYLIPNLEELNNKKPELKIYIMFGNDDYAGNIDILNKHDGSLFELLSSQLSKLNDNFSIVGYPFVPLTPFSLKDWEKWDLADINQRKKIEIERDIQSHGIYTWNMKYEGKAFNINDQDSIEKDMEDIFNNIEPEKTLFIFHSPPFNTNLDVLYTKEHIGSLSIRMAIEKFQPFMTLHGHIHETVEKSGKFIDRIGDTLCASAGNHNTTSHCFILDIHLSTRTIKRIKLE